MTYKPLDSVLSKLASRQPFSFIHLFGSRDEIFGGLQISFGGGAWENGTFMSFGTLLKFKKIFPTYNACLSKSLKVQCSKKRMVIFAIANVANFSHFRALFGPKLHEIMKIQYFKETIRNSLKISGRSQDYNAWTLLVLISYNLNSTTYKVYGPAKRMK